MKEAFETTENIEPKGKENLEFLQRELIQDEAFQTYLDTVSDLDHKNIPQNKLTLLSVGDLYSLTVKPKTTDEIISNYYDIAQFFLIVDGKSTSNDTLKIGDKCSVNFGKHADADRKIGAGDLLKPEIKKVKINGVEGERRNYPRPGYYTAHGKYLAIHDLYEIEILEIGALKKEELVQAEEAQFQRYSEVRTGEVLDKLYANRNKTSIEISFFGVHDSEIIKKAIKNLFKESDNIYFDEENNKFGVKKGNIGEELHLEYEGFGIKHFPYQDRIKTLEVKYPPVPAGKVIQLIYKENPNWNPYAEAPSSSAYGLGQMTDSTWALYGKGLDRNNPDDQLESVYRYMQAIQKNKSCSWEEVLAYYNTGEGIQGISNAQAREFAAGNPIIANKIPGVHVANGRIITGADKITAKTYYAGALAYYNDTPFA